MLHEIDENTQCSEKPDAHSASFAPLSALFVQLCVANQAQLMGTFLVTASERKNTHSHVCTHTHEHPKEGPRPPLLAQALSEKGEGVGSFFEYLCVCVFSCTLKLANTYSQLAQLQVLSKHCSDNTPWQPQR